MEASYYTLEAKNKSVSGCRECKYVNIEKDKADTERY